MSLRSKPNFLNSVISLKFCLPYLPCLNQVFIATSYFNDPVLSPTPASYDNHVYQTASTLHLHSRENGLMLPLKHGSLGIRFTMIPFQYVSCIQT